MVETAQDLARSTERRRFDDCLENFEANWIWRAVHALVGHPEFQMSATWISRKLGISLHEAVEAIEGLEYIGLIKKTPTGVKASHVQLLFPEQSEANAIQKKIVLHRVLTEQILNQMQPQNKQGFHVHVQSTRLECVKKLYNDFLESLNEFTAESEKTGLGPEEVFGITFSAVQLSGKTIGSGDSK